MRKIKSADDPSLKVDFYYSREIKGLSDLQVGDPVIFVNRYNIGLSEVKKITPTTIVISNDAIFYKENGRQKGGVSGYDRPEIHLVNEPDIKQIRHLELKRAAAHKFTSLRMEYLSIDQLNEVISLAENLIKSNTEKTEGNKSRWIDRSKE